MEGVSRASMQSVDRTTSQLSNIHSETSNLKNYEAARRVKKAIVPNSSATVQTSNDSGSKESLTILNR